MKIFFGIHKWLPESLDSEQNTISMNINYYFNTEKVEIINYTVQ